MVRKLGAEFVGTAILVYFGCGVAVLTLGSWHSSFGTGAGIVATALAFGLILAGLAYSIGPISGCHVNPAVTLGAALGRRLSWHDAVGYWVAQFAGGIAGAGVLDLTLRSSPLWSKAIGLGADGYGSASMIHVSAGGAFLAEAILTAVFVFVILSVTGKAAPVGVAGLMIGLTLTVIHLFGIPVTGTSVNPARSLGPAVFLGGTALHQVWLFLVAPLVGGALAAALYRGLHGTTE